MNNKGLETRISEEILSFIGSRKSLQLSTLQADGTPYASYAPFAIGDECLYILISEIAIHTGNLRRNPKASVLIIEDEDNCNKVFARIRVNYAIDAELLTFDSDEWKLGIDTLFQRHGKPITNLSALTDFKLFKLNPSGGRYVKDFGRAYTLEGNSLAGEAIVHLRGAHKTREVA